MLLGIAACTGSATGEETVTSIELNRHDPNQIEVGVVTFLAGFELELDDPAFGGLSGLALSPDGKHLTAVSDQGWWVTANLAHDAAGRLTGVTNLTVQPILDADGRALPDLPGIESKIRGDAEALASDADGGLLVGFERDHRVWSYADPNALPVAIELPPEVLSLSANSALESIARLPDGRLLIIAEAPVNDQTLIKGWILETNGWRPISYVARDEFEVTDIAALPDGRIIVLERWFAEPVFLQIRLREISPNMLQAGTPIDGRVLATFSNPLLIDNFEGLAARPAPDGGYLLYMISDDNYNAHQRTLFYQFHLDS